MARQETQASKHASELQAQLKNKVVEILAERQNDIGYIRMLNGSQEYLDGACDDVFDAIEDALVQTVRKGQSLSGGDDAYEAIGDIAWAMVTFLEDTAHARIKLEGLLNDKCEELVKGSESRRWKNSRRTRSPKAI